MTKIMQDPLPTKCVHNLIIVDESGSMEVIRKQAFTLIGTDNLDVETMAHSFAIDEHLEFQQDEAGTKAMFARERRSRERYNCCVAEDAAMPVGSFFNSE